MWRETRIGLEAAALRRSPVFRGLGLPAGDRRPVLLIPGFMAGDASLGTMAQLAAAGRLLHAPHRHPRQPRLLGGGLHAASRRGSSTWPSATASAS